MRGGEPGRRLADSSVLAEIEARSQTALALEACGVARLALEDALEYASSREQFGKKIGVYQAVSHPLADAYTRVELSRSLALWAAWCVATGDAQAPIAAVGREVLRRTRAPSASARPRSSRSAASASPGSTGSIGCTSARSGSRASARPGTRLRAEIAASLLNASETVPDASPAPVSITQGG